MGQKFQVMVILVLIIPLDIMVFTMVFSERNTTVNTILFGKKEQKQEQLDAIQ